MEIGEHMKVLVTGVGGQLGYDVVKVLKERNIEYMGADLKEFDITDYAAAHKFITDYRPDAIIHCSAYTAVDRAEDEPALCQRVNVGGTENIAKIDTMEGKNLCPSSAYFLSPPAAPLPACALHRGSSLF